MKRATKFTLVELLIVLAVIAILVSMLLPALNKARESGKSIVCINNLLQIGKTFAMYAGDYHSWYPTSARRTGGVYGTAWYKLISSYCHRKIPGADVLVCPKRRKDIYQSYSQNMHLCGAPGPTALRFIRRCRLHPESGQHLVKTAFMRSYGKRGKEFMRFSMWNKDYSLLSTVFPFFFRIRICQAGDRHAIRPR